MTLDHRSGSRDIADYTYRQPDDPGIWPEDYDAGPATGRFSAWLIRNAKPVAWWPFLIAVVAFWGWIGWTVVTAVCKAC